MGPTFDNPLTDDHLDAIKAFQVRTKKTQDYLDRCSRCGLDVEEEKAKNAQQIDVAEKIRKEFFGDK